MLRGIAPPPLHVKWYPPFTIPKTTSAPPYNCSCHAVFCLLSLQPWKRMNTKLACCGQPLAFFRLRCFGKFTLQSLTETPVIQASNTAADFSTATSIICIRLRWAKTDPFGRGMSLYLSKTGAKICPGSVTQLPGDLPPERWHPVCACI